MTKTAVVLLAGDRPGFNPLCQSAGVTAKVLVPVAGRPVILRVLDTLAQLFNSPLDGSRLLCGPRPETLHDTPELENQIANQGWRYLEPGRSPASTTAMALAATASDETVLVTTADHGLLEPEMVTYFLAQARRSGADAAIALVRYEDVMKQFPGSRRTAWNFKDDAYCGCNLFVFLSSESHRLAEFWRQVEQQRKHPWRIVNILGFSAMMKFLTHRLTLQMALDLLGKKNGGLSIAPVLLPYPDAAVDVDSVADWELVNQTLQQRSDPEAVRGRTHNN